MITKPVLRDREAKVTIIFGEKLTFPTEASSYSTPISIGMHIFSLAYCVLLLLYNVQVSCTCIIPSCVYA